jgi:hypothetical protein
MDIWACDDVCLCRYVVHCVEYFIQQCVRQLDEGMDEARV